MKVMFLFEKIYIPKYRKFAFFGQMSLRIIAELLKNAPVLCTRSESFWQ